MEKDPDQERRICPNCGGEILPGESTVWPEGHVIHLECWEQMKKSRRVEIVPGDSN